MWTCNRRDRGSRQQPPQDDRYEAQDSAEDSETDYNPEEGDNAVVIPRSPEVDQEADLGGHPASATAGGSSKAAKELQKGLLQLYRRYESELDSVLLQKLTGVKVVTLVKQRENFREVFSRCTVGTNQN